MQCTRGSSAITAPWVTVLGMVSCDATARPVSPMMPCAQRWICKDERHVAMLDTAMYNLVEAVQGVSEEANGDTRQQEQLRRCREFGCSRQRCHWCTTLEPRLKSARKLVFAAARGVHDRVKWRNEAAGSCTTVETASALCALALLGPDGCLVLQFYVDALRHCLVQPPVAGLDPGGFGVSPDDVDLRQVNPTWTPEMTTLVARAVRAAACDDDAITLMAHFPCRVASHTLSCADAVRTVIRIADGGVKHDNLPEYQLACKELRECSNLWADLWTVGEREFANVSGGGRRGPPPIVRRFMGYVASRSRDVFEMYGGDAACRKLRNPADRPGTADPMRTGVLNLQSPSGLKCRKIPPFSIDQSKTADKARCKKIMVDAVGDRSSLTELITAVCAKCNSIRHLSATENEVGQKATNATNATVLSICTTSSDSSIPLPNCRPLGPPRHILCHRRVHPRPRGARNLLRLLLCRARIWIQQGWNGGGMCHTFNSTISLRQPLFVQPNAAQTRQTRSQNTERGGLRATKPTVGVASAMDGEHAAWHLHAVHDGLCPRVV